MKIIYQMYAHFTQRERQLFWAGVFVLVTSGTIWSIAFFHAVTVPVPVTSAAYREGIVGQPTRINPVAPGTDADRDLVHLLFIGLLDLAESYAVSEDGQTWTVKLNPDAKWSDGKPLTSDDVVFTVELIQNTDARSPLFPTWRGVIVNRISERSVEFTLRTPYVFFVDNLKELRVIPKHIFSVIPPANLYLSEFNLEPVGSGPYAFSSFKKQKDGFISEYYLVTNKYTVGKKPFIKDFVVKFYRSSGALIDAFNANDVDGFGGLDANHSDELTLRHAIFEKQVPQYYAVFINKDAKNGLGRNAVFDALSLAMDKEKLTNTILSGFQTSI